MQPLHKANAVRARDGAAVGSEESQHNPFKPTAAELQEWHHEALIIMADWKDDILRKQRRLTLVAELVGGITQAEIDCLKEEADLFQRCSNALTWRPDEAAS
jgi:hypothetical protein